MIRIASGYLAFVLTCALPMSPAQATPGAPQAAPAYAESPEGLKQQIQDIFDSLKHKQTDRFDSLVHDLRLPDERAWFSQVFGDENGAKLADAYAKMWTDYEDGLDYQFKNVLDKKFYFSRKNS